MQLSQQDQREKLASNLLFGSFLAGQALFYYGTLVLHRPVFSDQISNPWVVIPLNLLTLACYYAIRRGKRWAKWLLLGLVAITLPHALTPHRRAAILMHMSADSLYAAKYVLSYLAYLTALGLLFYKPNHAPARV